MARIAAQPLEIAQLRLAALGRGDDVVALAILRHPTAGLAGVLVPALDCLYQPPPRPTASAFAPAVVVLALSHQAASQPCSAITSSTTCATNFCAMNSATGTKCSWPASQRSTCFAYSSAHRDVSSSPITATPRIGPSTRPTA